MKISQVDILSVDIPFKFRFKHAQKTRETSESIFVRIKTETGEVGFGESLPRSYVTGEDQSSVMNSLKQKVPLLFKNICFSSFAEVCEFLSSLNDVKGAAKCALELALLDSAGRVFKCSVSRALGEVKRKQVRYSLVIDNVLPFKAAIAAIKYRLLGFRQIKLKAGDPGDLKRLKYVRSASGRNCDLRLDVNGAWNKDEAIRRLTEMQPYHFSVVEQPVAKNDIISMKAVKEAILEPVMADESVCTYDDAEFLIEKQACDMFNIRLSKCGGLLDSLKIYQLATKAGISCQLGCLVGETGILSAAGRCFAACIEELKYVEGSYGRYLLAEDIVQEDIGFGYGGIAHIVKGIGLGVTVREDILDKYVLKREVIYNA